jgi:putative transposase
MTSLLAGLWSAIGPGGRLRPAVAVPDPDRLSEPTFYKWRSKYGGMEVSGAKRLKALEDENARLKKLLAESMLDVSTLHEMLGKKKKF